jgi:hypothetical protein
MVLKHQADLKVSFDSSGRQHDEVVYLNGDDLERKADVFRRGQRHRNKTARVHAVSTAATSAIPALPTVSVPAAMSAIEADFSAGQDDLSMWWEGDELLDLVNAFDSGAGDELLDLVTASFDSGAGGLASAVAASVQVSGTEGPAVLTADVGDSDVWPMVAEIQIIFPEFETVLSPSLDDRPSILDEKRTVDASSMTVRRVLPGHAAVADAVASLAIADPSMGVVSLAVRAANVLGVDPSNDDAMSRITTAAEAALRMERLLSDILLSTAASAALMDASGLSGRDALVSELSRRRSCRLEPDGAGSAFGEPTIVGDNPSTEAA